MTWYVTHEMWHMTCDTWRVTHYMWHMTCDTWHVTHDIWHMTYDMWHVTRDRWGEVFIFSKYQVSNSYGLGDVTLQDQDLKFNLDFKPGSFDAGFQIFTQGQISFKSGTQILHLRFFDASSLTVLRHSLQGTSLVSSVICLSYLARTILTKPNTN